MTHPSKPLPPSLAKELAQIAREARVELFGPDGIPEWGTKFVDIERQALDVGHEVARIIIEQSVAQQSQQQPPDKALQLDCENAAELSGESSPLTIATRAGRVNWDQPLARPEKSAAAFFPSGQSAGT